MMGEIIKMIIETEPNAYAKDRAVDFGIRMVENESEVEKATEDIFELARSLGLEIKRVRGKGMEYFYRYKPEVYKIIEDLRLRYE